MQTKLLNILVGDEGQTLEVTTPVSYLFDYCTMLHQKMQSGVIPINCKIHSIIPLNSVVLDLEKPNPDLMTQLLEVDVDFSFEQRHQILNKLFKNASLHSCPKCNNTFNINDKESSHQVNDLFTLTFCSASCSLQYTEENMPELLESFADDLSELISRLEIEGVSKETLEKFNLN